jgi:peptidoglycan/xylan/chitin deacetylase (PgdA/CDA1 family)
MRAVLMYHSLDDSGSPISVSPAAFRAHAQWLASGAVDVVPLTALLAPGARAKPQLALTFDDGFANLASHAFPLLAEHRLPATVFVVSEHVGGDNRWQGQTSARVPALPLLSWDALGRARDQGVEIGAHTRTHPHLSQLDTGAVTDEMAGCSDTIARELGTRPATFAYPFGDLPADVMGTAGRHFQVACTTVHRLLRETEDPHRIPRLDAWYFRRPDALETMASRGFRTRVLARHALRVVRRTFRRD